MEPKTYTAASNSRRAALPAAMERDEAAVAWRYPQAALSGVLPQQQPFRDNSIPETMLAWLPDEDGDTLVPHRVEDDPAKRGHSIYVAVAASLQRIALASMPGITAWGEFDLLSLLSDQAEALGIPLADAARKFATVEVPRGNLSWRWHPCLGFTRGK
jgi:CRISPR-associated endonuclease/helicase Cas3